jgi:hypothetical protein
MRWRKRQHLAGIQQSLRVQRLLDGAAVRAVSQRCACEKAVCVGTPAGAARKKVVTASLGWCRMSHCSSA